MNKNFIRLIILLLLTVHESIGQENRFPSETEAETIYDHSGYFTWNENTVIKTRNLPPLSINELQSLLDHSNTDFSDQPESLIVIEMIPVDSIELRDYSIRITQDTIKVKAHSEKSLKKALAHLRQLKRDAENESPDYGLLYLRCGLYRSKNF